MQQITAIVLDRENYKKAVKLDRDKFNKVTIKPPKELKLKNTWLRRGGLGDCLGHWAQMIRNLRANGIEFKIIDVQIIKQLKIEYD